MRIEIASALLEQIVDSAESEAGEICGLLLGRQGRVEAIRPARNVAPDPARHFELDPVVLIAAHRASRGGGPSILGHYHSHPGGQAVPSSTDAACAVPDASLWLIVAGRAARLWVARAGAAGGVMFEEAVLAID